MNGRAKWFACRQFYGIASALLLAVMPPALAAPFSGEPVRELRAGPDFQLPDTSGRARTLRDFRGRVVLLFFGFLSCPDICPGTLSRLASAMQALGDDAARTQVVFVTLDPERDRPAAVQSYVAAFDPRFIGLVPPAYRVGEIARSLGAYFNKVPGKQPGSYTLDHTAGVHAYDPQGRLRLTLPEDLTAAQIAADVRRLLAGE